LARKRLTKKEMKEDTLVTYALLANDFASRHKVMIVVAALIVIASITGVGLYRHTRMKAQAEVSEGLLRAQMELERGSVDVAIQLFQSLIDRFPRLKGGLEANVWLGNAYQQKGDYQNARKAYRKYIEEGKDDILMRAAKRGLAACLEADGKFADAAEIYEDLARQDYSAKEEKALDLSAAGRLWELAGEDEKAAQAYDAAAREVPDSPIAREARIAAAEARTRYRTHAPVAMEEASQP